MPYIAQNFMDWTSWSPGCSPSAPVQQTRERIPPPCDPNIQCETNCSNIVETRNSKQNALQVNSYMIHNKDQLASQLTAI